MADESEVKPARPSTSASPTEAASRTDRAPDVESAGNGVSGGVVTPPVTIRPLDITVPGEIDRYTIGRRIGSGTCGVVHQAMDNLLGREVAVKLSPMGEAHVSTGKVPGAQRAYQTEIIAAGRLTHPNIVTVYDAGQFEELNYLVMEVVEGKSLKEYGKGKTLLPVHEALRVIAECCVALDYSHKQGILHRDIKPANIMLANNGVVKLLDFGIAVGLREESELKRKGPTLGTPNYMSPEQILGRELGSSSDFYSLATVLFELLTGRQLFKAGKVKDLFRMVVHRPAPRLRQLRPDLPVELSNVLARALEKKPEARFQTGLDMAQALQPHIEKFGLVARRPAARQKLVSRLKRQAFFRSFSDGEINQFLNRVRVRNFRQGDVLVDVGETQRRLLVLTDGVAQIRHNDSYRRLLADGDCFGEARFINGTAETDSVLAQTDVKALELSTAALDDLPTSTRLHYYRHISDLLMARRALRAAAQIDITL